MKYISSILIALIFTSGFVNAHHPIKGKKKIIITATIDNCGHELGLYRFDGVGFLLLQTAKNKINEPFVFEVEQQETTILYVGQPKKQKRPLVIGPEAEISIRGGCDRIRNSEILVSQWNKDYDQVISRISNQKRSRQRLIQAFQRGEKSEEAMKKFQASLSQMDINNHVYIDSMMQVNPFLGKLAAINSYTSFATDKRNHKNELDHYGYEFFADIALEDPAYDHLTYLFEAFSEYSRTLARTNAPKEIINKYIDHNLNRIVADRPAYKTALGGIVLGLQGSQHPSYLHYGEIFIDKYNNGKAEHIQNLAAQLEGARALLTGGVAPDFTAKTPEGEDMSLSQLRGNFVLIDFWASWCGPCRRENPNVVKLYEKYHDKGFDILGVSLDNKKDRWLAAIEKDGLTWNHISDLKRWQSQPARLYGVSSIPATVLLDKEGKVIARNLRGPQLEGKLKEIFGF